MMNYKNNQIRFSILAILIISMAGCSKMDSTYQDFWKNGEKVYPASPDSLKVYPGKNRIKLTWLILGDPTVSKAKIFWNNGTDSLEVPVSRTGSKVDTVKVLLENMQEGLYTFNIYAYDEKGHSSVEASAVGKVYGDAYANSLLIRIINSAFFLDDSLRVVWGDPADQTSLGSEIVYTDTSGTSRHLIVPATADTTVLLDYDFNAEPTFRYRTLFLPDSMAIDTFYTAFKTIKVKGPRVELSKSGWTATAYGDFDNRSGSAYRPPSNAIDNDPATVWVSHISVTSNYPHTIYVDMGNIVPDIEGLSFIQRTPLNGALKLIEVQVSQDTLVDGWKPMGEFTLQNIGQIQYIDFAQPETFRYFKVIGKNDYSNSKNLALAETGVFTR